MLRLSSLLLTPDLLVAADSLMQRLFIFGLMKQPNERYRNFFQDVYDVVRLIPPGRVSTYGAIAHYLGSRHGARTVGWAMQAAHALTGEEYVPCHRVINRNGVLTGKQFYHPPAAMQEALEAEGVPVVEDKVTDFGQRFWDPSTELQP